MTIPGKNSSFTQAPVDEAEDELDGIFKTESPELITESTREEFNTDHVIYGLVGTFYLYIDWRGISSICFNYNNIVNA